MCRHPCYSLVQPKPNVLLTAILREAFPKRSEALQTQVVDAQLGPRLFPLFLSTAVHLPEMMCSLHLFEARYRMLSRMALDSGGDFVMVWARGARGFPLKVDPATLVGVNACVVHIDESQQSPDGRFYLQCRGTLPVRIEECWVDEGNGYLYMARCVTLEESKEILDESQEPGDAPRGSQIDDSAQAVTAAEATVSDADVVEATVSEADAISSHNLPAYLVERIRTQMHVLGLIPHGHIPTTPPADMACFSWQAAGAGAGWILPEQLQILLDTRNTYHRLAILSQFYSDARTKRWSLQYWVSMGLSRWRVFLVVLLVAWAMSDIGLLR